MDADYPISNKATAVFLEVSVSTPGEATTVAWKMKDGHKEKVASNASNDPTGKVKRTKIGGANLKGFNIKIRTIIDLQPIEPSLWNATYDNLVIEYTMDGGVQGIRQFDCDSNDKSRDDTRSLIVVVKTIHITNN